MLWVTLPLDVPILQGANDVRFVGRAELHFDLVTAVTVGLLEEEVMAACLRLNAFFVFQDDSSEPKNLGFFRDSLLDPLFGKIGVVFDVEFFEFRVNADKR